MSRFQDSASQPEANPRIPFAMQADAPPLSPYRGRRVIVNFAGNVEHWCFDQPMPRAMLTPPHGIGVPQRMASFTAVMRELAVHPRVAFATSSGIGDGFNVLVPATA